MLLAGCATLSKTECEAGDWRNLGVVDGMNGYPVSRFDRHIKACARYDIAPDKRLYLAGREEGLLSYCHLDRASRDGLRGRTNYSVCSGELGISFNHVYDEARAVYRARQRVDDLQSEIDDILDRLARTQDEKARRAMVRDIQDLRDDIDDQQRMIDRLQQNLNAVIDREAQRLAALGIAG